MFVFGLVGYFFDKFKYSNAAVILGLILGEIIENSLRKQIIIGDGSGMGFVTRPVSVLVLTVAVLTFLWPMMSKKFKNR
jgi:putative tricarboxylic transport membrane protein